MAEEFRFVVKDTGVLKKFNLDPSRAKQMRDSYVARNKRVRYYPQTKTEPEHFVLIIAEPGSRIKKNKAITKREAIELVKNKILVIEKKGLGHIRVLDVEGYAEHIQVFSEKSNESFIDEIQIEFEESEKIIPALTKEIEPLKIIKKGLFDYAQNIKNSSEAHDLKS
jgi:hypothetical protein